MNKFEKLGAFYLGRLRGEAKAPLLYDSKDLTTHGLVVGMTGSGKTGLIRPIQRTEDTNGDRDR